jgi:hypothetical protein
VLDLSQKSTTLFGKVKETAKQSKAKQSKERKKNKAAAAAAPKFWSSLLGPPHFFFFGWRNFGIVAKAKQSKSEVLFCGTGFFFLNLI